MSLYDNYLEQKKTGGSTGGTLYDQYVSGKKAPADVAPPPAPVSEPQQSFLSKAWGFVKNYASEMVQTVENVKSVFRDPVAAVKKVPEYYEKIFLEPYLAGVEKAGEGLYSMYEAAKDRDPVTYVANNAKLISGTAEAIFSPVTGLFSLSKDVPGLKQVADVLDAPFSATGFAGSFATGKAIDWVPDELLSQESKAVLKGPLQELGSLAGQVFLGGRVMKKVGEFAARHEIITPDKARRIVEEAKTEALDESVNVPALRQEVERITVPDVPERPRQRIFDSDPNDVVAVETYNRKAGVPTSIESIRSSREAAEVYRERIENPKATPLEIEIARRDLENEVKFLEKRGADTRMYVETLERRDPTPAPDGVRRFQEETIARDAREKPVEQLEADLRFAYEQGGLGRLKDEPEIKIENYRDQVADFGEPAMTAKEQFEKARASQDADVQSAPKYKRALAQIRTQLELSEPGYRYGTSYGKDAEFHGVSSTFPQWIPEHLRRKSLFEKVMPLLDPNNLSYPKGNRPAQRQLYDTLMDALDDATGTNTRALRDRILASYERTPQKEAAKPSDRGTRGGGGDSGRPPARGDSGGEGVDKGGEKSRVYERLKAEYPEELKGDLTYEKINLKEQAERAVEMIEKDKQQAFRVAMGAEVSKDVTSTAVNIAMAERALKEGNAELFTRLVKNRSLEQTRRGQEIVSEKGSVTDNSVQRFVKELVAVRLEGLGKRYLGDVRIAKMTNKQKGVEILDKEVKKAQGKMKSKELDLAAAQKLIDSLACK